VPGDFRILFHGKSLTDMGIVCLVVVSAVSFPVARVTADVLAKRLNEQRTKVVPNLLTMKGMRDA